MSSLAPIDPEMVRQNRRLIAERTGWPECAVAVCEAVEGVHPEWSVSYLHENTIRGFERPAGFYATVRKAPRGAGTAYGVDAEALTAAIAALSSDCPVCGVRLPVPPGSTCPPHRGASGYCQVRWTQPTKPSRPAQAP